MEYQVQSSSIPMIKYLSVCGKRSCCNQHLLLRLRSQQWLSWMFTLLMNTITNLSLSSLDWNYNYVPSYVLRIGKSKKKQGVEEEKEEVDGSRGPSRQIARSQVTSCARSFYGGAPLTLLLPTRLIVVEPKRKRWEEEERIKDIYIIHIHLSSFILIATSCPGRSSRWEPRRVGRSDHHNCLH